MREGSPPHTCHVSGVTCHMSHVTCQMSDVTCQIFFLSGEDSQGRVCYQRGLPRLVSEMSETNFVHKYLKTDRYLGWFCQKYADKGAEHDQGEEQQQHMISHRRYECCKLFRQYNKNL